MEELSRLLNGYLFSLTISGAPDDHRGLVDRLLRRSSAFSATRG